MTIQELREKLSNISVQAESFVSKAETENRDLTDDEIKQIETLKDDAENVKAEIVKAESRMNAKAIVSDMKAELSVKQPRKVQAEKPVVSVHDGVTNQTPSGFKSFGEFASHVMIRSNGTVTDKMRNYQKSPYVQNAATTFSGEGSGADGLYTVAPSEFYNQIFAIENGEVDLASMCFQLPITSSNMITVPTEETTVYGTTGVRNKKAADGIAIVATKQVSGSVEIKPKKNGILVNVSDEILQDSNLLGAYLSRVAPERLRNQTNYEVILGNGTTEGTGVMTATALVSQAKDSNQTAATITATNIANMWGRMYPKFRQNACWLLSASAESYLISLAVSQYNPIVQYVNGQMFILGKPAYVTELCAALGTTGDILLVDLKQMLFGSIGGIESAMSIHLYFDQALTAFRFITRYDCKPWLTAAITPRTGDTQSAFVKLDVR